MRRYRPYKLWLHYLWVFIVAVTNLVLYGAIFLKVARGGSKVSNEHRINGGTGSAAQIMLFFPILYIATMLVSPKRRKMLARTDS